MNGNVASTSALLLFAMAVAVTAVLIKFYSKEISTLESWTQSI